LKEGSQINALDKEKCTPLAICFAGDYDIDEDVVEFLLEHGADPNLSPKSPLYSASRRLLPRTVDVLLRYGADANFEVKEAGDSLFPLYIACVSACSSGKFDPALHVCESLLIAGAEVDALGPDCVKALMVAPSSEITKLLLRYGANIYAVIQDGFGAHSFSAQFGFVGSLKVLVQAGDDPEHVLFGAFDGLRRGGVQFGTDEDRTAALDFALWAGASPSKAIFYVTKSVPFAVVQKLLWYGASITETNVKGLLPIQVAFKEGASSAVLSLLAPNDGYQLTDPKTNKSVVITKTDPGPPLFTTYELDFEFCAHCRKGNGPADVLTCAACMLVAYCDEECQRAHREKHKPICKAKRRADKWRAKCGE
jgi:hypothetical protein